MIRIKTILHPTDFSEPSKYALTYALSFAEEYNAKLCVLHVIEEVSSALYFDMLQAPPLAQLMADIEKQAQRAMEELIPAVTREKYRAETLIRKGVPFLEAREKNHFIRVDPPEWQQALDVLDANKP